MSSSPTYAEPLRRWNLGCPIPLNPPVRRSPYAHRGTPARAVGPRGPLFTASPAAGVEPGSPLSREGDRHDNANPLPHRRRRRPPVPVEGRGARRARIPGSPAGQGLSRAQGWSPASGRGRGARGHPGPRRSRPRRPRRRPPRGASAVQEQRGRSTAARRRRTSRSSRTSPNDSASSTRTRWRSPRSSGCYATLTDMTHLEAFARAVPTSSG